MGDRDLLELRIHGVNNTPPVSLLYAIQEEYGDSLTGVYRLRGQDHLVKAYSWGGLARTSPTIRLPFAGWLKSVVPAVWIFAMPFGLANVAYWSRKLTLPGEPFASAKITAGLTRVFALGLTLLFASSVCSVSLDMAEGRISAEGAAPPVDWLAWLKDLPVGQRTALFSLIPAAAILALWVTSAVTRSRYDQVSSTRGSGEPMASTDSWKFGTPSFWTNADLSKHNARLHMAASLALTLIWTGQFWADGHPGVERAVIGTSVGIIMVCTGLTASLPLVTEDKPVSVSRWLTANVLLAVTVAVFLAQSIALCQAGTDVAASTKLAGLSFVPGALTFVLFVIAVSALGWRRQRRVSYVVTALPVALGAAILAAHQWNWLTGNHLAVLDASLVGVLALLAIAWAVRLHRVDREAENRGAEAWRGTAPGVWLLLALFAAVLLSTVFVMTAAALLGDGKLTITRGERVKAPPLFLSFASTLPFVVGLLVALILVVGGWVVLRCQDPIEEALRDGVPSAADMTRMANRFDQAVKRPWWARLLHIWKPWWRLPEKRCLVRRLAAIAHRAEPLVAWFVTIVATALCAGLVLALLVHDGVLLEYAKSLDDWQERGVGAAVIAGGLILGLGGSRGRPLGIVWDLVCFLPRASHPYGPPCYAQKAVPELLDYCRAWLDTPVGDDAERRRLLLSAHSLGGVLAVAVVLLLSESYPERVALVTYGCQLRAYFGRIFPELLGPRVLGVTNARAARLLDCPTFAPVDPPPVVPGADDDPKTMLDRLTGTGGPLWINLWRPTDYLGFPAYSRLAGNPLDRRADEITEEVAADGYIVSDPGRPMRGPGVLLTKVSPSARLKFEDKYTVRVDTHSDYFRAPQYATAVTELAQRLRAP